MKNLLFFLLGIIFFSIVVTYALKYDQNLGQERQEILDRNIPAEKRLSQEEFSRKFTGLDSEYCYAFEMFGNFVVSRFPGAGIPPVLSDGPFIFAMRQDGDDEVTAINVTGHPLRVGDPVQIYRLYHNLWTSKVGETLGDGLVMIAKDPK